MVSMSMLIEEYMLEGHSFRESVRLAEETFTPDNIHDFERMPGYKRLENDIKYFFKAVDDIDAYRDGDFKKDPVGMLKKELDFCDKVEDFIGDARIKGFDKGTTSGVMNWASKTISSLENGIKRLRNKLAKQDNSDYLRPDGSVDVAKSKHGLFAYRALRALRDFFGQFGEEFAYDPDFDYKSAQKGKEDYSDFVADFIAKPKGALESRAVIDSAINEGVDSIYGFRVIAAELGLRGDALVDFIDCANSALKSVPVMEESGCFEVAWQEFDRNDRPVAKRKQFKTQAAMSRFIEKLKEKDNFYQLLAYSGDSESGD